MSKKNCESEARKKIAASIGATPEEIYFTSGRADGHLKALKAVVKASKKARPHVIITTMEHSSNTSGSSIVVMIT